MIKRVDILKNEEGYFLILATLMILALLTILGIAASRTANTEITVSANELIYQRNFYLAEGAVMEAVDHLINAADLRNKPPAWLDTVPGAMTQDNLDAYWDEAGIAVVDPTGNTRFVAGLENIGAGSSLDVDKTTVHAIGIYGQCEKNGVTVIKVGYLATY